MLNRLIRLLFPEHCHKCGTPGTALCHKCTARIPLAVMLPKGTYAVFDYGASIVRTAIKNLKYRRHGELGHALMRAGLPYIVAYIADTLHSTQDEHIVLVPIPEHHKKRTERGFNQSELLARWIHKELPGTIVSSILEKTIFTLPQARLNRTARLKNVRHTMKAIRVLDPAQLYIVIDDVTTTGATFTEAKRALLEAGARKIICIALAHGYANT